MTVIEKRYFSNDLLNDFSCEEIKAYQEERLRSQMKYCYERSNFYKEKFKEVGALPDDIQTLEDLRRLPVFMDKDQERENAVESLEREKHPFGTHLCAPVNEIYLTGTTSGTTGTPTFTYTFTKMDLDEIGRALGHRFSFIGVEKGDRVLFIFALGIYATTMSLWGIRGIGALPIDIDARAGSDFMLKMADLTRPITWPLRFPCGVFDKQVPGGFAEECGGAQLQGTHADRGDRRGDLRNKASDRICIWVSGL